MAVEVPAAAADSAAQAGHECVDCNKVTEVELIYLRLTYPLPGAANAGGGVSRYNQPLHLSDFTFFRSVVKPEDLWGESVTGATLEEKSKAVQKLAKTKAPIEDFVRKTPERAGVEQIFTCFCLMFDMGSGGVDIGPGREKWSLPTWEETPTRKDTGIWMYDNQKDYGLAPRLRILKGWGNATDTEVRAHCGKEYKAINASAKNDPYPSKHSHLSRDRRGKWTELRSTAGCLRVSTGDMLDMYETLKPYSRLNFSYSSPTPGNPLLNYQSSATRTRGAERHVNPYLTVMYMYAEGKEGYCAIRNTPIAGFYQTAAGRAWPTKMGPHDICESATWYTQQHTPLLEFYKANPDE